MVDEDEDHGVGDHTGQRGVVPVPRSGDHVTSSVLALEHRKGAQYSVDPCNGVVSGPRWVSVSANEVDKNDYRQDRRSGHSDE